MAYASSSDVAALTPHLLSGVSNFSTSTSPTLASVNAWLSTGSAIVNSKLASRGYGAIPTTSTAYEMAQQINATYAAWMAERSLLSARISRDENTRDNAFKRDFEFLLNMLMSLDLSRMGVSMTNKPPADWAGGISEADKRLNEADTDIVQPRFGRGMFDNRDATKPRISTS